ncbi:DoxX family protein [Corynebacterium alimapuense]|uniref:DoxX family protein n=1 Tax=Corynebacterium alimapuense TaxID=1576874 RepID=A0A3M8K6D5_9CORY|nr:DoxX family protein [Corynebacterium alimapuense]RNE48305.1 DoxX family protein [Corynebacterium alimapuense]
MIRKIARPMIASVYIADGADTLINTSEHVDGAQALLRQVRVVLPRQCARNLPTDPELIVRSLGLAKVGAGSTLAVGFFPRVSATVLAAAAIPTMLSRHSFWETQDTEERAARRSGFLTSFALLGGLMITSMDTEGKPGLRWRAHKAAEVTSDKVQAALPTKDEPEKFADSAKSWFEDTSDKVSNYATLAQDYVHENKDEWIDSASTSAAVASASATDAAHKVTDYVHEHKDDWLTLARDHAAHARKEVVKAAAQTQELADQALAAADQKAGIGAKKARKHADKLQSRADKALVKAQKQIGTNFNR